MTGHKTVSVNDSIAKDHGSGVDCSGENFDHDAEMSMSARVRRQVLGSIGEIWA
jgi:hypothetical protein